MYKGLDYWKDTVLTPGTIKEENISEFLETAREIFINGGVEFASFSFGNDPKAEERTLVIDFDAECFFRILLTSEAFRNALPQLQPPKTIDAIEWEQLSSFDLECGLTRHLIHGGAYEKFSGSVKEAKLLSERTAYALFAERYDDLLLFRSWDIWSPWFSDIAWHWTWIGFDRNLREVWVLCITDTD